ncbi:MAG: hypothetical protein R3B13_07365 [Polyangiaceae bacterium]
MPVVSIHRRVALALALVALGCTGDPVGELPADAGSGGTAGSGGSGGAGGIAGSGGSGGAGGIAGSGGGLACDGGAPCVVPLVPASGASSFGIDLDATDIYYASGTDVWRLPRFGGTAVSVASGLLGPRHVAVDDIHVVFSDGARKVYVTAKSGGGATLLYTASNGSAQIGGVATDGSYAYFTETSDKSSFDGAVSRVALSGGLPKVLALLPAAAPEGLFLDGAFVYVAERIGQSVVRIPAAGGAPTPVATGRDQPVDVVVSGNWIAWAENGGIGFVSKGGGTPSFAPTAGSPSHIAADDSAAYVTLPAYSAVYRAPLGGTNAMELVGDAGSPEDLVVGSAAVYFTNYAAGPPGSVLAIPK